MQLNGINKSSVAIQQRTFLKKKTSFLQQVSSDCITFKDKRYSISRDNNVMCLVSFAGKPSLPISAIKVDLETLTDKQKSNIKKLYEKNWFDSYPLDYQIQGNNIIVLDSKLGEIGCLPEPVSKELLELMNNNHHFKVELADIRDKNTVLYNQKLRINIKYLFKDNEKLCDVPKDIIKSFKKLLTGSVTSNYVFAFQPVINLNEFLEVLIPEETVTTIVNEINKARNILLVSHKFADGDAIGSVMGLGAALELIGKKVDCSIDDVIEGQFRHKLPGIDEKLKKPEDLNPETQYDLVIVMDTPIPSRIGDNARFLQSAKKVIFIDHHEYIESDWVGHQDQSGFDMKQVQQNNLFWNRPDISAVCQLVTGLVFKIIPPDILNNMHIEQKRAIAKPLAAGMLKDSFYFKHGEEYKIESFTKGLMYWARFYKKWLNDNIKYDFPDEAALKLKKIADDAKVINESAYASIQITHDQLMDVFRTAQKIDPEITINDIKQEIKNSTAFLDLIIDPATGKEDRLAVILIEVETKDTDGQDYTTISLRSPRGSGRALRIAMEIGGGGHPDIAGIQLYGQKLKDKVYESTIAPGKKLDIEEKIAELADRIK